ncbi:MAG: hypothetical protein DME06_06030 [Candidatus Rokuibacteriota bacterium]|nr:MAG: hypothetical protein DME06_06030 [Candidatus Rokubacteria bacterium]
MRRELNHRRTAESHLIVVVMVLFVLAAFPFASLFPTIALLAFWLLFSLRCCFILARLARFLISLIGPFRLLSPFDCTFNHSRRYEEADERQGTCGADGQRKKEATA